MTASSENNKQLTVSYILWLVGFFGFAGLHRIYNRKFVTGFLWLFTWGLFGVGQFVDVFLVPGMAEERQLKRLKAKYGDDIYNLINTQATPAQTVQMPTREEKMVSLLKTAQKYQGQLSVTQAVMDTGFSFAETESLLQDMVKSGYVGVDNHPQTGIVVYRFEELAS
ncbi:MAG: TM2 domain-containing protein [Cyanobacteria bacterium P01_H01_bin.58]